MCFVEGCIICKKYWMSMQIIGEYQEDQRTQAGALWGAIRDIHVIGVF